MTTTIDKTIKTGRNWKKLAVGLGFGLILAILAGLWYHQHPLMESYHSFLAAEMVEATYDQKTHQVQLEFVDESQRRFVCTSIEQKENKLYLHILKKFAFRPEAYLTVDLSDYQDYDQLIMVTDGKEIDPQVEKVNFHRVIWEK